MRSVNKKLYVVGIDSAPVWIIKELHKKHRFVGGFADVLKRGVLTDLESTLPPLTPAAWPSIYTGLEPKDHGMMDFFRIDRNYTKQLLYFDSDAHPPFWDEIATLGLKSLVITPAVVLKPSDSRNVEMMTGWPLKPRFNSERLQKEAARLKFDGEPSIENELQSGKTSLSSARDAYLESIRKRSKLVLELTARRNYDLSFVCFTEPDRMQHYSLNRKDWRSYVGPLYYAISDFISGLEKHIAKEHENATILIVSDHGAQPIEYKFLLNAWLINNGYASLKAGVSRGIAKEESSNLHSRNQKSAKYALREALVKSRAKSLLYDRLPPGARRVARGIIGKSLSSSSGGKFTHIHDFDLDMKSTRAFTSVSNDPVGMVWINDSRFSNPTVHTQRAKSALKSEIMHELSRLRDRSGGKLVTKLYDGRDYYGNTRLFIAPDILLSVSPGYMVDVKNYSRDSMFMPPELAKSGDHIRNGVIGFIGPAAHELRGNIPKNPTVCDVHNAILRYFGAKSSTRARKRPSRAVHK